MILITATLIAIGGPERFFGKLNALFPGIVNSALRRQNRAAREMLQPAGRP